MLSSADSRHDFFQQQAQALIINELTIGEVFTMKHAIMFIDLRAFFSMLGIVNTSSAIYGTV